MAVQKLYSSESVRESGSSFKKPIPIPTRTPIFAYSHKLFNPAPPEAVLTYSYPGARMIKPALFLCFSLLAQAPTPGEKQPLQKSAFFAFVDRDYIFTIELVKPGVPLLNFVSTTNEEARIYARDIRLALDNRKVAAKLLAVETGDSQYPMSIASIAVHPRSSFAVRIDGDFGNASQFYGATLRIGNEDFQLVPLSSFDFEALVLKVNRLNLGSPDFRDDWRVLRLEPLGSRSAARKREREK